MIHIGCARCNAIGSEITNDFKHLAVILHCIVVVDRCIPELPGLCVLVFRYGNDFLQIQSLKMKMNIRVVEKEIRHICTYFNLFLKTSMNRGITSVASPTMP